MEFELLKVISSSLLHQLINFGNKKNYSLNFKHIFQNYLPIKQSSEIIVENHIIIKNFLSN